MRTIAIINQKGGVGKTTTVANLGAALARAGKTVAVFDMDPQANLSMYLGTEVGRGEASVYGVLTDGLPIGQALRKTNTPGLSLLASHLDLSGAELELASTLGRETLLRDALHMWVAENPGPTGFGPVDYVLLDCPPSLGLLSVNALVAADEVMIAVQTEFFALQGLGKLVEVIQLLRRRMNPGLVLSGVIPCLYDSRLKLAREVLGELRRFFPDKVFRHPIRNNVRLAESPSHSKTIFEYAPESNGAKDYSRLAEEILTRAAPTQAPKPSPVEVVFDDQAKELKRAAEGLSALEAPKAHSAKEDPVTLEPSDPVLEESPAKVETSEVSGDFGNPASEALEALQLKQGPKENGAQSSDQESSDHAGFRADSHTTPPAPDEWVPAVVDDVDAELATYEIPRAGEVKAQNGCDWIELADEEYAAKNAKQRAGLPKARATDEIEGQQPGPIEASGKINPPYSQDSRKVVSSPTRQQKPQEPAPHPQGQMHDSVGNNLPVNHIEAEAAIGLASDPESELRPEVKDEVEVENQDNSPLRETPELSIEPLESYELAPKGVAPAEANPETDSANQPDTLPTVTNPTAKTDGDTPDQESGALEADTLESTLPGTPKPLPVRTQGSYLGEDRWTHFPSKGR